MGPTKRSEHRYAENVFPSALVAGLCNSDNRQLAEMLRANMTWDKPTGDLYQWIDLLNHFDVILASQIEKYSLQEGSYPLLVEMKDEDVKLITACLDFTAMLLDHCRNDTIYSSPERIYALVLAPNIDVRLAALNVAVYLGDRYVQLSNCKKFSAPRQVRLRILEIARSFPPAVPTGFIQKSLGQDDKSVNNKSDHYSLVDVVDHSKRYPSRWKHLSYQYFITKQLQQQRPLKKSKDKPEEGLVTFSLSEDQVKKLTLEQIYDKASAVLPEDQRFSFSLAALNAKAFNTRDYEAMKLRDKLVQVKANAVAFTASMCSTEFTLANLFEMEPYVLSFLVDLISPEYSKSVSEDVLYSALKALQCISAKKSYVGELIRHLGGNVSHGMLFQILRNIHQSALMNEGEVFVKGHLTFFSIVCNFVKLSLRLAAGALLTDLMAFLTCRTRHRWTCSASVNTIAVFLTANPTLIAEFGNNGGFQLLIDVIGYEVQFALDNPQFGGGPPKDVVTYYTITLRQSNYLRNLLKLVSQLILSEAGERLRNLFDSQILQSFNKILANHAVFGPSVIASTMDVIMYIIHNEPSAYAILDEAGVISSVLSSYADLFVPSSEVQLSGLEVLGAISLNKSGLQKVVDSNAIPKFFRTLRSLEHARELMREDMSSSVGSSLDELGRHYPALRPIILKEIVSLLDDFPSLMRPLLKGVTLYSSNQGILYELDGANSQQDEDALAAIEKWASTDASLLFDSFVLMLVTLLQDSGQWGKSLMKDVPAKSWFTLLSMRGLTYDFSSSTGFMNYLGILKYLDDENKQYAYQPIIEYLSELVSRHSIVQFLKFEGKSSYFEQFKGNNHDASDLLNDLNEVCNVLSAITEIYLNPALMLNDLYVMMIDGFSKTSLVEVLAQIAGRSIIEDLSLSEPLDDGIATATTPTLDSTTISPPLQLRKPNADQPDDKVRNTARYKNTLQLRFFMHRLLSCSSMIFSCISRSCMQRRQDFFSAEWRFNAISQTEILAKQLQAMWTRGFGLEGAARLKYQLIMVHMIQWIATCKDKGKEVFSTSFILFISEPLLNLVSEVADAASSAFDRLLEVDIDDFKDYEDPLVQDNRLLVEIQLLKYTLAFLTKLLTPGMVINFPFAHLFISPWYEEGGNSYASGLIMVNASPALKLVTRTIGSQSRWAREGDLKILAKLPLPILKGLITLLRQGWQVSSTGSFVALDKMQMKPSKNHVDWLALHCDLPIATAWEILKNHSLIEIQNVESLPDIDEAIFARCKQAVMEVDMTTILEDEHDVIELTADREKMKDSDFCPRFPETLFDLASIDKSLDKLIALTIRDKSVIGPETFSGILDRLKSHSEGAMVDQHLLANLIWLFQKLICNDPFPGPNKVHTAKENALYEFLEFFLTLVEKNSGNMSPALLTACLVTIEPVVSQTPPNLLESMKPYFPSLRADVNLKKRILNAVTSLDFESDLTCATAVSQILFFFAKDDNFRGAVAQSNQVMALISKMESFIEKGEPLEYRGYQDSVISLIRTCFETPQNLNDIFTTEITKLLKKHPTTKKDLKRLLDENRFSVARDPSLYIKVVLDMVRIEKFVDDTPSNDTIYLLSDEKTGSSEDVEMEEASQESPNTSPKLMHHLVASLMRVSKEDWVSTPPQNAKEPPVKGKESHFETLVKSKKFGYMCFLLQTITELLGSYKQAKLDFITFSKSDGCTLNKPRPTSLNFFIHQLIPSHVFEGESGPEFQRREAISSLAKLAILSLVSSVVIAGNAEHDPKNEDLDMAVVRKFLVDIIAKIMKNLLANSQSTGASYSKMYDLHDLCGCLLSTKFRELCYPLLSKSATKADQFYFASAFIEAQLPAQIMATISGLDLNFPNVNRLIKVGLKPLTSLSKIKLGFAEFFEANSTNEKDDEVEELDDGKDDTPDLFRNSTLGMYDIDVESDDDGYYDEDGPLEELTSNSDSSDGEDTDDSDALSESGSDEDTMMEDAEEMEDFDDYDEEDSQNDIEIIDELAINTDGDDDDDVDSTGIEEFHGFEGEELDEEDASDEDIEEFDEEGYDEAELGEWIEAFEGNDSSDRASSSARFAERFAEFEEDVSHFDFNSDEEDNNGLTDEESNFDSAGDDDQLAEESGSRRAREFVTFFFNSLQSGQHENVGNLFGGLIQGHRRSHGNGILSGSIHIGNSRQGEVLPHFADEFDIVLNHDINSGSKSTVDHMLIRSTVERWRDAFVKYIRPFEGKFFDRVRSEILSLITEPSLELHKERVEAEKKLASEEEKRWQKRREEMRIKREEEIRQREAEREQLDNRSLEPIMVLIGDREVDISGTDIDPEFFEALPDDMREEVFTQHVRQRRADATSTGTDAREIDPDFLDALPDQIREEILQQESLARRFSGSGLRYLDYDDESENEDDEVIEDDFVNFNNETRASTDASRTEPDAPNKVKRKTFAIPLIDKSGVAGIVRLLFASRPVNHREQIYLALLQMCHNKQTSVEVISLLIAVLHDGLYSQKSLEKIFGLISARALNVKPSDVNIQKSFPIGSTPIIAGIQFMEAVFYLLEKNHALRVHFMTEHENQFLQKNHYRQKITSSSEKKYPINLLLEVLNNPLLNEEHFFIDLLASVLHFATRPLLILRDKLKSAPPNFHTNFIPEKNVRSIVKIVTSEECANTTFRRAISAMQHLSLIGRAKTVLLQELSRNATHLGNKIVQDLQELTDELQEGHEVFDESNKCLGKFTAASSDQAKLLRVLTALDYMFVSQKKDSDSANSAQEPLSHLYKDLELGSLWDALSACLRELESEAKYANVATALLPLIEALMVICKHCRAKETQTRDKYEAKKVDFSRESSENLFFSFTDEHKKILNQMVRSNPNLMSGPFSMLVRNPKVLEFDNKKNFFDRQLHDKAPNANKLSINIRRDQVFLDSYRALFFKSVEEFRNSRLEINFKGESGIDAGGVTREWFQVLSRQMFNPDYALFTPVSSDENTFHPNRTSFINPEHLSFFKFIGRIIGKAIFDGCFLDCHFSRALYKKLLDRPVSLKDMENLDLEYFKSLMWMLENDITDIITEDFSVEADDYGEHKILDLIPNGRNIPVTEENKHEYVRLVTEYRLQTSVSEQMSNFIIGFHEIIPKDLVSIFDEQELELLISGMPDIDVQDWQTFTSYSNYSPSSEQIQWFWRAVKSFDNEERAKLLQFATGTSKVPLNGFKELRGANGLCKFSIHRDYGPKDRLPSSHTCFNQIDLPAYETYETLRGSLLLALTEGHEGFGLA